MIDADTDAFSAAAKPRMLGFCDAPSHIDEPHDGPARATEDHHEPGTYSGLENQQIVAKALARRLERLGDVVGAIATSDPKAVA